MGWSVLLLRHGRHGKDIGYGLEATPLYKNIRLGRSGGFALSVRLSDLVCSTSMEDSEDEAIEAWHDEQQVGKEQPGGLEEI